MAKKTFTEEVDELGRSLIKEAKGEMDFRSKIAIFANLVKWAAIKNKIEPDGEEGSGYDGYRKALERGDVGGETGEGDTLKESARAAARAARRSTHTPLTDSGAAIAAAAKEASEHTGDIGDLEFDDSDTKPPSGSFPVNARGVYIEPDSDE